jgi:hypothetical protein
MFLSHMQYTDAEALGLSVEDVFGILLVCQIVPLARYSILFMNLKPFQLNTLNSFPRHALPRPSRRPCDPQLLILLDSDKRLTHVSR